MAIAFRTTGTLSAPECFLRRSRSLRRLRLPVSCAVIERPDGLVLIDTGWSRAQCAWPSEDPGILTRTLLGMDVRAEDALASQLLSLGYSPADVRHVIATHLHLDHIGGVVDFPNATVHCTATEWDARQLGLRGGYHHSEIAFTDRLELHTLREPPRLGFPASHDLFGDGTVYLLAAPGHTRGSCTVAVKLADRWLLHAGDACMFREEYLAPDETGPWLYARLSCHDFGTLRRTHACLRTAEREHGALIVPSHDPAVYATLPTTFESGLRCAWESTSRGRGRKRAPRADLPAEEG